jgi:hypothetical protein
VDLDTVCLVLGHPKDIAIFLQAHTQVEEDGNRSSFRIVVLSSFLEYQMMGKIQKPSNSNQNLLEFIFLSKFTGDPFSRYGSRNYCDAFPPGKNGRKQIYYSILLTFTRR